MTTTRILTVKPGLVLCLWLALMLILCNSGCIIIPTAQTDSGYARTNLNPQAVQQFAPGKTTVEEVIAELGEPDAASMDDRQLAYRSEKVRAYWIVAATGEGSGVAAGGTIYKNRFYILAFDPQGRLQSVRQAGQWGMVGGADEPALNNSSVYFGNTNNAVVGMVRGGYWLPNVDGFRSKGAKSLIGEEGQFLLTESNLVFATDSHFANTEPDLDLPLTSIVEVNVNKFIRARRLVVRTGSGTVHSFQIYRPSFIGSVQDNSAMQAACDFIQSKIKPVPFQK